jgi:propanediol dehydratase small subunit
MSGYGKTVGERAGARIERAPETSGNGGPAGTPDEATPRYPLGESAGGRLRSSSGVPLDEVTLEALRAGRLGPDDLGIDRATLELQARIAAEAGYGQLAENLQRAAELVAIPNERLLQVYEALRPHRSSYAELLALGDELEARHGAAATARFIRDAASAYRAGGLLR